MCEPRAALLSTTMLVPHRVTKRRREPVQKYIIMGVQGCGKGTQAKLLEEDFDLVHISVGDIFRWNIQNHTKLGARIKRLISTGGLVSDDIVEEIIQRLA